ncbi:ribose 5-phosphate isomerase B [Alphaproteobacteria bacterium]|jgi:ribose 5-phosphate isomerase B|nr:ribose 5-phosphate isomerase B [Alphaproteobacteria bacterium]
MKIFIGSDHAGILLKKKLKDFLEKKHHAVFDCGASEEGKSVDYPDFAQTVCDKTLSENSMGVLICGSGIGMSIAANRRKGIRAALCWNEEVSKLSRQHNNANILVLSARLISYTCAEKCLDMFLKTSFEGGRHQRRLDKIDTNQTEAL